MADRRGRWTAGVVTDVATRDGRGWAFTRDGEPGTAWAVFREDGGAFPVFSTARGTGPVPPPADRAAMTRTAVGDLLTAAGLADPVGWITGNLTRALVLTGERVDRWEGVEWAVESGPDDRPLHWAGPAADRTPYAWLRASGSGGDHVVSTYQDDLVFGLAFDHGPVPHLPDADDRSLRPHRAVPLVTGEITGVAVAYDTTVDGGSSPGLLTEVHLRAEHGSALLVAAEAYERDDWRLNDESVVALPDPSSADTLAWNPPRRPWSWAAAGR